MITLLGLQHIVPSLSHFWGILWTVATVQVENCFFNLKSELYDRWLSLIYINALERLLGFYGTKDPDLNLLISLLDILQDLPRMYPKIKREKSTHQFVQQYLI